MKRYEIRQFQVDAFTNQAFGGNPAAVCPLEAWLDDSLLQAIAEENNLSETAFFVPDGAGFHLRWFAPVSEIDLCGHATLASAHVLFEILGYAQPSIAFQTRSGTLTVRRENGKLTMDFPADPPIACRVPGQLAAALGATPEAVLGAADYLIVFDSEATVRGLHPDFAALAQLDRRGVIVTAPGQTGSGIDFVSRFFVPKLGIAEDPVTGSSHTQLIPYWSGRLGKTQLTAKQVSRRGGDLWCEARGDRVEIAGTAVVVIDARLTFDA